MSADDIRIKNVCKHGVVLHKECGMCTFELHEAEIEDQVCLQKHEHDKGTNE
jgi:hypothetical protein